MTELLNRLERAGTTLQRMEKKFELTPEHVQQLIDDTWLQIRRRELQMLLALAIDNHMTVNEFLTIRPHPAWETFAGATPVLFRGRVKGGDVVQVDADVENQLTKRMDLPLATRIYDPEEARDPPQFVDFVRRTMTARNCIFLGGPKYNPYTEAALALLWGVTPFSPNEGVPVRIGVSELKKMNTASSFCVEASERQPFGFMVKHKDSPLIRLKTNSVKQDESGWDVGLLLVCRRPLNTDADVTTIVIFGHQAPSTIALTENLYHGLPYLGSLNPGDVITKVFLTRWEMKDGEPEPVRKDQIYGTLDDAGNLFRAMTKPSVAERARAGRKKRS